MARRSFTLLAGLLSAALLAALPAGAAAAGDCTPAASWPADRADLAAQVVALVNAHRAQLGLAPLVVSPTLTATAQWKARNMAALRYLDHDDPAPDARTADERVAACGYRSTMWGENIAIGYSTAQAVFDAWLGSPEHRANIERPEFRATGVGAAGAPTYWAQSFGATVDAGSVVPAAVAPAAARAGRPPRRRRAPRRWPRRTPRRLAARELRAARPRHRLPGPRRARIARAHRARAPRAARSLARACAPPPTPSACACTPCAACAPGATRSSSAPARPPPSASGA